MKSNLQRIINENPDICNCVRSFTRSVPPLNLDIFALITDGVRFELLILEVKLMNSVGLKEWSQLVGYCLVSNAKYGLLVNINNGASQRLNQILSSESHLSRIVTKVDNDEIEHDLGFMKWDSLTRSFDYSNLGLVTSISSLCDKLSTDFNN